MSKKLNCRDVGPDCDYVATGETEDEIMTKVAQHAHDVHGITEVPPELAAKALSCIKDA